MAGSMACPWGALTAQFSAPDSLVDLRTGRGARGRRDELRRDRSNSHGERVLHLLGVGGVPPRVHGHARSLQGCCPHQRAVSRGRSRRHESGQGATSLWRRRDRAPVSFVCVSHQCVSYREFIHLTDAADAAHRRRTARRRAVAADDRVPNRAARSRTSSRGPPA